ncbi:MULTISPECIES: FecR family protein [unclassified Sphingobacterium]|uniref:FecR family protein n=1 Tax=unclassified Sphingobacterium TaxID=2609468 RepID=UPI0025E5C68A|nr:MULTISPECIES: FecR domain-containing protein [unclassified Sphingobacterium]
MKQKPEPQRLQYLAEKWLNGTISAAEKQEFDEWYFSFEDHIVTDHTAEELDNIAAGLYKDIQSRSGMTVPPRISKIYPFKRMLYWAASVLILIGAGAILYIRQDNVPLQHTKTAVIIPGSERGNLQLGDGNAYDLEQLDTGIFLKRSGVEIVKTRKGEINYTVRSVEALNPDEIVDNTVSTPNGGQYKIQLSDGTRIWLNAASVIRFPIAFVGDKRMVELQGEAYFEVSKDPVKPFIVKTGKEEVRVLGTHFNVNSYEGDPVSRVSLLEGKVEVLAKRGLYKTHLLPGQQTVNTSNSINVESFNTEESIAWKNGEFIFNNERLDQVMLKVGRWYDADIIVDPEIAKILIWGSISKSEQIDKVLKLIQLTNENIKYRIEGRRIYMSPK